MSRHSATAIGSSGSSEASGTSAEVEPETEAGTESNAGSVAPGAPARGTRAEDQSPDFTVPRAALVSRDRPFQQTQLSRIDEALTLASRETGLLFSVYVGELGPDPRATAEALFAKLGRRSSEPVLIALSPAERKLEIVTGGESARRIPNRAAGLAALAMRGSFSNGDLAGGIVSGLRQLADAAGRK